MTLRPGSSEAIKFFNRSENEFSFSNTDSWNRLLSKYPEVLKIVENKKNQGKSKKSNLVKLDKELFNEDFQRQGLSRGYITSAELSKIIQWKLSRGKFRPLQGKVDSNSDTAVKEASKKAFECMKSDGNIEKALRCLADPLAGVGPASASLILAIFFPGVAFMADEALDVLYERDYTFRHARELQARATDVASKLNAHVPKSARKFTANAVSNALWVCALGAAHDVPLELDEPPVSDVEARERKRPSSREDDCKGDAEEAHDDTLAATHSSSRKRRKVVRKSE